MEDKKIKTMTPVPAIFSKRWILAYISMLGFCMLGSLQVNMSVAIVCMVRSQKDTHNGSVDDTMTSSCRSIDDAKENPNTGELEWDKYTQSIILSSFFYGYIMTQVAGGWLSGKFGAKLVFGGGILMMSLATILIPVSARWDFHMVVVLRAVIGAFGGFVFPSMYSMWGVWAPPQESSKLSSFCYSGYFAGGILAFVLSGWLCESGFDNGWGSIFYITGGVGLLWCVAWFYLVSNSPDTHPTITIAEKDYINGSLGGGLQKKFKVPWRSIFKSRALWICALSHFCNFWTFSTLLTELPNFLKNVLKFSTEQSGVLSAIIFFVGSASISCSGHIADHLRSKHFSTRTTRRLIQVISFLCCGGFITATGYIPCSHRDISVLCLALVLGFDGLSYSGLFVNHVDYGQRYAGVLFSLASSFASLAGIFTPLVSGALTPNKTIEEWRSVFLVCGGFALAGALMFGAFSRGELEVWARDDQEIVSVSPPEKGPVIAFINAGFRIESLGTTLKYDIKGDDFVYYGQSRTELMCQGTSYCPKNTDPLPLSMIV